MFDIFPDGRDISANGTERSDPFDLGSKNYLQIQVFGGPDASDLTFKLDVDKGSGFGNVNVIENVDLSTEQNNSVFIDAILPQGADRGILEVSENAGNSIDGLTAEGELSQEELA